MATSYYLLIFRCVLHRFFISHVFSRAVFSAAGRRGLSRTESSFSLYDSIFGYDHDCGGALHEGRPFPWECAYIYDDLCLGKKK